MIASGMMFSRRTLLATGAAATLASAATGSPQRASNAARFSLGYAPHEGSFASRGGR